MKNPEPLDRADAETYASWFKALADGTRVQLVSLLARAGEPMTVGQIVAAVPVGQSTVSAHLKQLAAVGFVLAEAPRHRPAVPDQRQLRGVLPYCRRPGHGTARPAARPALTRLPGGDHGPMPKPRS